MAIALAIGAFACNPDSLPDYHSDTLEFNRQDSIGFDGMIARFSMQNVHVGLAEGNAASTGWLLAFPSPALDEIAFMGPESSVGLLTILDATGRQAVRVRYQRLRPVDLTGLAPGTYTARLTDTLTGEHRIARFIKE